MSNLIIVLSLISSIITIIRSQALIGYEILPLLPIFYTILYSLFIKIIIKRDKSIIAGFFTFYGLLRYVITPVLIVLSDSNSTSYFLTTNTGAIEKAILLMVYEMIILTLTISFYSFSKSNKDFKNTAQAVPEVVLKGRKFIYVLLGIFAIVLLIAVPPLRNTLSFLILRSNDGTRIDENISTSLMLARQILLTAIVMTFVSMTYIYSLKYKKNNYIRYFYICLIFSFFNIAVIVGERRSMQIYTAFATMYLLITLFPQFKDKVIKYILLFSLIVVGFMSVYKFFNAFLYDSYFEAMNASKFNIDNYAVLMQSYYFGPQNVAVSIEIKDSGGYQPFSRLIYDIARSSMGINFFVKNLMHTTSDIFNMYIYGKFMPSGHPVSGIGYGYMYFGSIFSPFISSLAIIVAMRVEYFLKKTKAVELKYILAYILIRIGSPFSAIPAKLNVATLVILSFGTVYLVANIISKITKKGKRYHVKV